MKDFSKYHEVIKDRITAPGAYYYEVPWWEAEIKQFTADIDEAIAFIENECTDEELYWLGEVFDDIMEKTLSKEFLAALRRRAEKVTDPKYKKDILEDIRTAAMYVE